MRYKTILAIMLIAIIVIITGCSKDEANNANDPQVNNSQNENAQEATDPENDETNHEQNDTDKESNSVDLSFLNELEPVPTDIFGIVNQPAGPYAGIDVRDPSVNDQLMEDLGTLQPLPEDATEEELNAYFVYLYSLVSEDFPDPQDTIKKWEFGSFGDPDLPDSRFHFKENYNVEVLLDGSGSMGAYIGNKTMMQIAKEAINNFMKQVPEEANVSLRVYGHKGTGSNSDKELSCSTIEQVYGYAPYEEGAFQQELDKIQPAGWTPLADALKQAEDSLAQYDTENNTNLIYVVSDGVETCDGDPVAVAKSLADSNAKPIINIIGFNVDNEAQAQLKAMAQASGGIFSTANDQSELEEEFKRAEEVLKAWEDWKKDALKDVESIRVDNSFDIIKVNNEWGQKKRRQFNNLSRLGRILKDEGIITSKQMSYLRGLRSDMDDLIGSAQEEVRNELKEISAEKLNELKQTINEKYNQGTAE